jgi:dihydrofolate reductase
MEINMIAAIGENGELGKDNKLLWSIPEDMKFFKEITSGHTVIMGRKTYDSIGRPLPKRNNLIITRNTKSFENNEEKGLYYFDNYITMFTFVKEVLKPERLFIIGGGEVYRNTMSVCHNVYLTRVRGSFDADTYFPLNRLDILNFKLKESRECKNEHHDYIFETYSRPELNGIRTNFTPNIPFT